MKELVALWFDRGRASADVKRLALEHVAELELKAKELQEMSRALRHLAENCQDDARPDCPIISGLAEVKEQEGRRELNPQRFGAMRMPPNRSQQSRHGQR